MIVLGHFQGIFDIRGYLWRDFRDFQGILESFGEFQRFLEIRREFWIVLGHFQGVLESFVELQRFLDLFFRVLERFFETSKVV